jgi:DNA-binding MarR family transcriptional regulator
VLVTLAAACVPSSSAHLPAGGSFTLTLSASPSPADPLLITFAASAVSGTITAYAWNFGDGQFFNGSGGAYAEPVHRYAAPGTYTVHLLAYEGPESANASLPLTVQPAPLHVSIEVTNGNGTAPLTVRFAALLSGGTGTFGSVFWNFGDGGSGVGPSLSYTFVRAGHFPVSVNVTDSAGQIAMARAWANVTAGPVGASPGGGLSEAVLIALAAAATGVVGLLAGIGISARRHRLEPATPSGVPAADGEGGHVGSSLPPSAGPSSSSPGAEIRATSGELVASAGDTAAIPESDPLAPGSVEASATLPPPGGVSSEALRLSQRIVLHLRSLGRLDASEVAPVGFSQHGMSEALHVRQNALANVLGRLLAAGVVSEELRHVQGQSRRLKVYRLTPRGEALATELRSRGHAAATPRSDSNR